LRFIKQLHDVTIAIRNENYDTAIDIYQKMMADNEKDIKTIAVKGIADCYAWKGDLEKAIEYADKALTVEPNDSQMLMLVARYWHIKQNEEMTYKFVCRFIENPPSEKNEHIPKITFWILNPFSLFFKNLRNIEKKAIDAISENNRKNKEKMMWAKEYKKWYEKKREQDLLSYSTR
jgi:tetratricopeptide (TPR) repeat protein